MKFIPFAVLRWLFVLILLNVAGLARLSPTTDEFRHWLFGMRVWEGNLERTDYFDNSKMPFSALNALPARSAPLPSGDRQSFIYKIFVYYLNAGRLATVFVSVLAAWLLYRWSANFYGAAAGRLSLFL